jgi:YegS/Rv2252/BmrU family lipid kinase
MRIKIILNPIADHGRAVTLKEKIPAWFAPFQEADLDESQHPNHARRLAEEAAEQGYDVIVAAGGDGTVHEIVNGIVHEGQAKTKLGVIPIGSGNDFAHGLGLNLTPEKAVARLFSERAHQLDLAHVEDEHGRSEIFNNGLGIGFDAMVNIQSRTITRVHGFAMYALATLRTIALYYQTPHMILAYDEQRIEQDTLLLAVGVGPRIGGGFYLTPDAIFDDNLLDSCTVNPVGRLTMLRMLPEVMRGTHVTSRHVTMRRSKTIRVQANMPLPIHIDGEVFAYPEDNVKALNITSLPAALTVLGA